jgi:proline dehydrogenase
MNILKSFENTEVAFKQKSNFQLRKAYLLFQFFAYTKLMRFANKVLLGAFKWHLPIDFLVRKTAFDHFCGGESIKDCQKAIDNLHASKVGTILDYSVEGKEEDTYFDATTKEIIATIKEAATQRDKIPFSVFKVTGLAPFSLLEKINSKQILNSEEEKEYIQVKRRIDAICQEAHKNHVKLLIDAEESWIQDAIDALTNEMMEKYNKEEAIVYNTLQMYRHDRLAYLQNDIAIAKEKNYKLAYKIVRGAYMEKERERALAHSYVSPIQIDKTHTDNDYNQALEICLNQGIAICAGTHNEKSAAFLAEQILAKNIAPSDARFYVAQLLGMSDHISCNLASQGFCVAKYVPYGPVREVMPYLIRRAEENTSVAGQTSRELDLIQKEIKRRKNN